MLHVRFKSGITWALLILCMVIWMLPADVRGQNAGSFEVPVKTGVVTSDTVSDQITIVGNVEAIETSIVASEVSGIVEQYPIREGNFVKKGDLLVRLRSTEFNLRLKGAEAGREKIKANLLFAEKELKRATALKDTNSIAQKNYDQALYTYQALTHELLMTEAEIDRLRYLIDQTRVVAPFSGFIAMEHTQVGEWINPGGPVATLIDLAQVRILVDVPERYAVLISPQSKASAVIRSLSDDFIPGQVDAVLPLGDAKSRTFPVRILLPNPEYKIKSGMEAAVTFTLSNTLQALLVPKDAVVFAGDQRMVYRVNGGKAEPVMVNILGYYDGNAAVQGGLNQGDVVVIRGNERLRPGQGVKVVE